MFFKTKTLLNRVFLVSILSVLCSCLNTNNETVFFCNASESHFSNDKMNINLASNSIFGSDTSSKYHPKETAIAVGFTV